MRIQNISVEIGGRETTFSAVVSSSNQAFPETRVYFTVATRVPEWFDDGCGDGFVISSLLLAMSLGEDLEVEGIVSPRLLSGLASYESIILNWFPDSFHPIKVLAARAEERVQTWPNALLPFSGGVDSFYSLWRHRTERPDEPAVSHALFVHGFDIPLSDQNAYDEALGHYTEFSRSRLGTPIIGGRTNIRELLDRHLKWELSHGAATIGFAMMLAPKSCYVAASQVGGDGQPYGSHPRLDSLLSTAYCGVKHDGAVSRIAKLTVLADWKYTFDLLRVCWEHPNGVINCCRCEKCLRTMVGLEIIGRLGNYSTFPLPLDLARLRAVFRGMREAPPSLPHESLKQVLLGAHLELAELARAYGRADIARAYDEA